MQAQDEKYMLTALRLAQKGIGSVEPNPAVGCVIVKDTQIIGKGWHKRFGEAHAEINALENCRQNGYDPKGSVMYVTLEPCCHFGKTPPCTDAIIKAGVKKIVVAMTDPFEKVSGNGIKTLLNAGIEVSTDICREQAEFLNAPFIKFAAAKKTWVILKWAQSIDGCLAWSNQSARRWISNEKSRRDSHKLRRRTQAILVGINTVLADDPLLTSRPAKGKKLLRVVLDSNLRIPFDSKLVKTAKMYDLLIVTANQSIEASLQKAAVLQKAGVQLLPVPFVDGKCDLDYLLSALAARDIQQLLVEGGAETITSFLEKNLADEICLYIAPIILGSNGNIPITKPMARIANPIHLKNVEITNLSGDIKITGRL